MLRTFKNNTILTKKKKTWIHQFWGFSFFALEVTQQMDDGFCSSNFVLLLLLWCRFPKNKREILIFLFQFICENKMHAIKKSFLHRSNHQIGKIEWYYKVWYSSQGKLPPFQVPTNITIDNFKGSGDTRAEVQARVFFWGVGG